MDGCPALPKAQLFSNKYSYVCEEDQQGLQIITSHHVIVKRNWTVDFFRWCTVIGLMACTCTLLSFTVAHGANFVGTFILCIFSAGFISRNGIQQESVVVMPTLGVQLETYYRSGKVFRRFVPMGSLLAAVINEAVTPFTCYWYLALIVRDERELALVFQELQPPLNMLVPIWKSLVSAVGSKTLQQFN